MGKLKTNKSISKRVRVTKNKKVMAKVCGQAHFNAKEPGSVRRTKRSPQSLRSSCMPKKTWQKIISK
ncbi:hypothetical protein D4R87_00670 [bacterium]|nr:MAG: hypothetical protein D4R87_00670 [bacterium]